VVVQQTKSFQKERLSAAPKQQITKYTLSSPPPQRVTVHKIAQTDRALLHPQQKKQSIYPFESDILHPLHTTKCQKTEPEQRSHRNKLYNGS